MRIIANIYICNREYFKNFSFVVFYHIIFPQYVNIFRKKFYSVLMQLHKLQIRPRICIATNSWAIRLQLTITKEDILLKFFRKSPPQYKPLTGLVQLKTYIDVLFCIIPSKFVALLLQ